jgi:predicted outer membrane lipoprotein
MRIVKFGEEVEGYNIPVLNEREIRASAGILFLMLFISFMFILSKGNFIPIKYSITIFLTDLLIRVFINPAYSPFLILGRLIVRNQTPEYVGAQQKKFAWIIGIVLASAMFVFFNIVNAYSIITGLTCLVCLIFLFFETAFGICLGCKVYSLFYKEKAQYCPGEVCDVRSRQAIQKTSWAQILVVLAFIGYIVLLASLFNTHFKVPPHDLFGESSAVQTKG